MTVAVEEGAAEVEEGAADEVEVREAPAASAETWRALRKEEMSARRVGGEGWKHLRSAGGGVGGTGGKGSKGSSVGIGNRDGDSNRSAVLLSQKGQESAPNRAFSSSEAQDSPALQR
jgi:hypothetical protein